MEKHTSFDHMQQKCHCHLHILTSSLFSSTSGSTMLLRAVFNSPAAPSLVL